MSEPGETCEARGGSKELVVAGCNDFFECGPRESQQVPPQEYPTLAIALLFLSIVTGLNGGWFAGEMCGFRILPRITVGVEICAFRIAVEFLYNSSCIDQSSGSRLARPVHPTIEPEARKKMLTV